MGKKQFFIHTSSFILLHRGFARCVLTVISPGECRR